MGDLNPDISILVPIYNDGKYIRQCVESVLGQSHKDFELWLFNNGSTDDSSAIARSYSDSRIHHVDFPENIGAPTILSHYARQMKGTYVKILSADDMLLPDGLSLLLDAFRADDSIELVFASMVSMNESGRVSPRNILRSQNFTDHLELARYVIGKGNPFRYPTAMFRRSVTERGNWNNAFGRWWDMVLWLSMIFSGVAYSSIDAPVAAYRLRKGYGNASHYKGQEALSEFAFEYEMMIEWMAHALPRDVFDYLDQKYARDGNYPCEEHERSVLQPAVFGLYLLREQFPRTLNIDLSVKTGLRLLFRSMNEANSTEAVRMRYGLDALRLRDTMREYYSDVPLSIRNKQWQIFRELWQERGLLAALRRTYHHFIR
ncbi:MAG: glycosyltransferase family 2 protein [Planctomycetes bacterium]|nr:glycosyltransferase family 2 protein [Planctomycetota bacterium]